jgi:hypothetical protein
MAKEERPATQITGEEEHVVHATWSRSGKNLILTVARNAHWADYRQVLLSPQQADELSRFLAAGPEGR